MKLNSIGKQHSDNANLDDIDPNANAPTSQPVDTPTVDDNNGDIAGIMTDDEVDEALIILDDVATDNEDDDDDGNKDSESKKETDQMIEKDDGDVP